MASKKCATNNKQSSLMNFIKKSSRESSRSNSPSRTNEVDMEKKTKFVWKSKSNNSKTWTPPFKNSAKDDIRPTQIETRESSPSLLLDDTYKNHTNGSMRKNFIMDNMDVDEFPESPDIFNDKCRTPSPDKSNKSMRISATPSPPKKYSDKRSPHIKMDLKTPEKNMHKNDKDPLKNLKLDDSISDFLSEVSQHPSLKRINKDKSSFQQRDIEKCKSMYIELLEKISNAFDRIPNCIKEKFPGYDKKTYAKMKYLKSKLKSAMQHKPDSEQFTNKHKSPYIDNSNNYESPSVSSNCDSHNLSHLNNYDDDLNDFDLESSQICGKKPFCIKSIANDTASSTPDVVDFNKKPGPNKTIYSDLVAKKSLSFDAFSPCNDSSKNLETSLESVTLDSSENNINRSKGKFVFKKPSRLTDVTGELSSKTSTPIRDVPSNTFEKLQIASVV